MFAAQEASQKVLELKHDDPDALEHVLQHIYSIPPPSSRQDVKAWRHWLDVHLTADKYLEFNLSAIARNEFTRVANSQRDSNEIFDILEAINDEMKHDEGFVQLAHSLREFNIEALLQNERVCKKVDEDKEWRWEIIDSLIAHRNHSGERSIFLCEHHIEQVFEPGRKWQSLPCSKCRKNEPRPVVNTRIVYSE